jgi:hypothetical protein
MFPVSNHWVPECLSFVGSLGNHRLESGVMAIGVASDYRDLVLYGGVGEQSSGSNVYSAG